MFLTALGGLTAVVPGRRSGNHNSHIPLIFQGFLATFAANKKWAFGPLISPPAGANTEKPADKRVAVTEYSEI
ncbi:MAG TPA: hypothetical protein VJX73_07375 [Terracidiphilus sp.]|nr:hypothetical protein [Terracidiphilus sp.]